MRSRRYLLNLIAWSEGEAKIKSLQQQAAQATGEMKAKLEMRIAEERADHQLRVEKLSKAWQLVKEAAAV